MEIDLARLDKIESLDLKDLDEDNFLTLWILSGCDYLPSVKGIGFKKAYKYYMEAGGDIKTIISRMKLNGLPVPQNYYQGKYILVIHRLSESLPDIQSSDNLLSNW